MSSNSNITPEHHEVVSAPNKNLAKLSDAQMAENELSQKRIETARVLKKEYSTEDWNLSKIP